jgi:hypothetical protein
LSPEARAKFNETAAQEFFWSTSNLPYGYHNFLFGWIDTPDSNWPPLVPNGFLPVALDVLEKIMPKNIDILLNQALNKRLGTVGLNLEGVAAEAAKRNLTVEDLISMVEQDGWEYTGVEPVDGRSYVCSAYVAGMYKAAGLIPKETNAVEFAPKDVYSLKIFDTNF